MQRNEGSLLHPVDDAVRKAARTLVRTARHGALAIIDASAHGPSVSRVGLATDTDGMPVFPTSSLSGRPEAMTRDGRAALLLGEPGGGDPLAHARLSLQGTVQRLAGATHDRCRRRYLARHPKAALYIDFADFSLWRFEIATAAYVAGFGKAYALDRADLETRYADWPEWHAMEAGAVAHMNEDHRDATRLYAIGLCGAGDGDWRVTGLDPEGIDLASRDDHRRYTYPAPLARAQELRPRLVDLVREARQQAAGDQHETPGDRRNHASDL
ncbi:HugZ family protein [Thioalkalivibrio sp. XN8]|nr:HugZ family protein [Thioalkalivibrio sp. XN8]